MAEPLPMDRFRANIVVAGAAPWAEDAWGGLRVGELEFSSVKPCGRCKARGGRGASGSPAAHAGEAVRCFCPSTLPGPWFGTTKV